MCNNVFKWFLRAFAVVAVLTVTSCADSPDEDDIVIPELSLSIDGTTIEQGSTAMMTFDETGGTKQFSIKTTGEWEISGLESAPQNFALTTSQGQEMYTGKGDETFTVTLGEATTASRFSMTVSVYASIFGQKKVADTRTITVVQTKGGELPVGKVIYNNNFDKEEATQTFGSSGSSWPYLDQFEGWKNQEGEGAAEVTYDFKSVSARANSKSDGSYSNYEGSGSNNLLFGGSGYLTIQNIAVSTTNLQLTFGTERYAYGESDNTFKNEEFLVTLSADGQSWSAPVAYAFEEGNDTNGKWNLATADFTLPDGTTKLYIKFATTLSGAHRVDDVKLTDGIGGQAITFEGGGDTPTPPTPGEAIYTNNFDKEKATKTYGTNGSSWPYIDQFEGWKNQSGSGASAVTYEGSGVSVRANSESNGDYSNYAGSGANNIFFGTNGTLTIGNIALISNKLCLTFGTERYINGQDNTFKNEEFLVTLSADGKTWSKPITYAFEEGKDTNGKWNVATADFTLPESVKTLYIKFASTLKSAHRIDDVTLTDGNGGQEIKFEGGDEPTPPTPGTMTVADLVAKCKAAGSTQTVLDADKDVVVEAVVVTDKDGGNTNSKNLAIMAEGATEAGNGILLFGSGITDPADPSYTWKSGDKVKVTLKAGEARACIYNGTYEITGSAKADWIAIEKIGTATVTPVELTTVDKLADYQSMVVKIKDATSPATAAEWCTADAWKTHKFTVGGSDLTVYVQKNAAAFVGKKFKASAKGDITGVVTVYNSNPQLAPRTADDVKAFNGEGGGDEPTPPTPSENGTITMSAADIIANGTTSITENNYGSQNVNDASTYYTWKMNDVTFAGARICKATSEDYAGLIQMQGNASDKKKQGFFGNADDLKKITKVVIVSKNTKYEPTEHLYVGTSAYPLGQNAVTRTDLKQDGQTYTETFDVSGDYGYFAVANDKQGAFYVESVTVYYDGEGGSQPDQPAAGKTATLTLEDIVAAVGSYNNQYKDTTITAADGSVWTGFVAGNNTRLQLGWNTTPTKSAAKSYLLVPNADKVIKKITFTPEKGTSDNRVLALLPENFEYTGQSADEVKAAAYACSANTVKESTDPLSVDLTGKNLKRFMIRAVGGAVYLTSITIEYAE